MTQYTTKKLRLDHFFRRAILYCQKEEDLRKEINYIVKTGQEHGYKKGFIWSTYETVKQSLYKENRTDVITTALHETQLEKEVFIPIPHNIGMYSCVKKTCEETR